MTRAVIVRMIESAVTMFLITFVTLAAGLLKSVDVNDHHAVLSALSAAAIAALVAAVKELSGLSTVAVKPAHRD